ncbi:MAG: hypothetical protein CVU22_14105 [Betaproteobacteria bacterium HGW-Betaproteobacteria-16]|nr:MAG: hypothetical protein CVU22_14105 [Betaproteobacteria bacterium HGW-Betaproteobacteria-16]
MDRTPTRPLQVRTPLSSKAPSMSLETPPSARLPRLETVAMDADESPFIKEPAPPTRKRRGRPKGSFGKILIAETGIQQSDLVFLRAVAEGVPPKSAAERYLGHRASMDTRTATAYVEQLQAALRMTIEQLADADERDRAKEALDAVLGPGQQTQEQIAPQTIRDPQQSCTTPPLATLEEFAQRFDPDMYTESELIDLYQAEYGVTGESPGSRNTSTHSSAQAEVVIPEADAIYGSRVDRLAALRWLSDHLSRKPVGSDPCSSWIEPRIAEQFTSVGVSTLAQLLTWINQRGSQWYGQLAGCGKTRARRLMLWLIDSEDDIGLSLNKSLLPPTADNNRPFSADQPHVETPGALVPLEHLSWPLELDGRHGEFRGGPTNTLYVHTDREAVQKWLTSIEEKSPATVESYRRSVGRLTMWAILERRRALSDLGHDDFRAFIEFLRNPPNHWVGKTTVMQISEEWRPFRGPQGEESIRLTMAAVSNLFKFLHKSGYLSQNAVPDGRVGRREVQMDVMRSFANEELDPVRATLEAMPDGPRKRRLRAIILLLQTAGMRRSEAVNATWGQITSMRIDNSLTSNHQIKFTGKGRRERTVPLQQGTIEALRAHYDDRMKLVEEKKLPKKYEEMELKDTPLLSILDERLTRYKPGRGQRPHDAPRNGNDNGALSASRLHGLLKGFFSEVAITAQEQLPGSTDAYLKASAHWFRHTFAHQVVHGTDGGVVVAQALLGHASLATTGLYVKANMTERAAAIAKLKPAV